MRGFGVCVCVYVLFASLELNRYPERVNRKSKYNSMDVRANHSVN